MPSVIPMAVTVNGGVVPMNVGVNGGVVPLQAGNVPLDGSITTPKLADGAVTLDKLDVAVALTVTDGDLTISLT